MLIFINPQGTHLYTMCTVSMNNIFAWWHCISVMEGVEHLLPVAYAIDLCLIATLPLKQAQVLCLQCVFYALGVVILLSICLQFDWDLDTIQH